MNNHLYRQARRHGIALPAAAIIFATALTVQTVSAFAQVPLTQIQPVKPSQIQFTATVPAAPAKMQVYNLTPTKAPLDFINEKLTVAKLPALKMEGTTLIARNPIALAAAPRTAIANTALTAQVANDTIRAYSDPATGDAHLIPNLAEVVTPARLAVTLAPARALSLATAAFADARFIPRDVTQLRLADAITVTGASTTAPATGATATTTAPKVVLTIHPALRYAGNFRVFGNGSQAVISLANDGTIVGALRRWSTAAIGDTIPATTTSAQVEADIRRQLSPHLGGGASAVVDKIEVAYIDTAAKFIQPVYHFEATIKSTNKAVSDIRIEGYTAIGRALEPIPDLATPATGVGPEKAIAGVARPLSTEVTEQATGGIGGTAISLGEYPNQDATDPGYQDMSNTFLSGLHSVNTSTPITRTQWYFAYPFEVVGASSKNFMNAVNIAYTTPHGDWLENTTLYNSEQFWYITNIGTGGNPGFGAAAGGKLATWIMMSCENIPSAYDRQHEAGGTGNPQTAFNAWWPVFQGLHNAIGFRTIMYYPDDNLQSSFGHDAALGGDLNSAWFQEVAANEGGRGTYASQHLIGSPQVHYDRASTMIDARNLGQSIYNVSAQTKSTTLWSFWMGN